MRLDDGRCWELLISGRHGVLGTVHDDRGVDTVPVVFAVVGGAIVIPVDRVKPKTTTELQRLHNVERDARCALLVDEYDDDWSKLWWVRVHGRAVTVAPSDEHLAALAARYPQYAEPDSVVRVLVVAPEVVTGWSAA